MSALQMAPMTSKQKVGVALFACASGYVFYAAGKRYFFKKKPPSEEELHKNSSSISPAVLEFVKRKKKNPAVDKVFLKQLIKLIKISIPSIFSKEFALLVIHTSSLVARTFLSIYIAHLDGRIVKSIVERKVSAFLRLCVSWVLISLPATFINSLLRFLESKLALAIRTRLVDYAYSLYFKNQTYYRVSNLDGRLANPDHSLTEDIQAFSAAVTHIYSHVSKPLLDVILMTSALGQLARKRGEDSPFPGIIGFSMIFFTGWLLRVCSPPFGKLVAEEARRNGYLRYVHSRVITNAEEVAFYGGHQVSKVVS